MPKKEIVIAIDPGASGALCVMDINHLAISFTDFKDKNILGYISELLLIVHNQDMYTIKAIIVEKVASMHGQGVKSVFSFGQRLGEIEGMLQTLGLGYIFVRPQEWQKVCGIPTKSGKKGIYETISRIYPDAELLGPQGGLKDGRCDALSMAHYARKTY